MCNRIEPRTDSPKGVQHMTQLKTTCPVLPVTTIQDIREIEAQPYDIHVTARNLYDLFRATALHGGTRKALTVLRSGDPDDVGVSLSHAEMLQAVTGAANLFRSLGLGPQKGGAAFLAPTVPALLLGAQVAGVASTINYLLSAEAIIDLLNAQAATILVIPAAYLDQTCWDKGNSIRQAVPTLQHVLVIGATEQADGLTPLDAVLRPCRTDELSFTPTDDPDAVSALFHTGGTTGSPKLVPLTHGNQIHAAFGFGQVFGYDDTDVVINGFPFFHVGGTMTVGLSVLAAGGHLVVPSPCALRPAEVIQSYWHLVEAFSATVVSGVPTSIAALTTAWAEGRDVSSVRMAVTGGAVLPAAVAKRFQDVTGVPLFETYGMTETAAAIAFNPGRGTAVLGNVGLRAPYSETRIVQVDDMQTVCTPTKSGLVQVRGPQVFPGYVDAAHNIGVLDGDGWLTTGDIGYLTADETLVLTGREKDLIVRSGHNIDPSAIEDVANRFPDVQISAAVGLPDQYAGEVPILFVVPNPAATIDVTALAAMLEAELHEPPARPRRIMVIDAFPVTAVGKIFKPALRARAIVEKLRTEVAHHCGDSVSLDATVGTDAQQRVQVDAVLTGATPAQIAALQAALAPLPQAYRLTRADPCVRLDVSDGVALLTLDRPDSLNAASRALMHSLDARLHQIKAIPDLRVVILTGAGRAFCAGGDLIEFDQERAAGTLIDTLAYNQRVISMIEALEVPVIGAANGIAVAGGLEMLLCCDILLAASTARLGDGHAKFGILPAGGATVRLGERIGPTRAAQLFFTAGMIDAPTAQAWGLVNEVVPADQLLERARELAGEIAACSPQAVRRIKRLSRADVISPGRDARLAAEISEFAQHMAGTDLQEGLQAFREKRLPKYTKG
ncbi:enoyl-CoA hydratase/isomerase family protein [Roseobacter sp. GAI101]|nr:enoyl-CoA hydratase/isomerase family protein [Roseobacter sp. GAI101]